MPPTLPKSLLAFFWHFIKRYWLIYLVFQLFCFGWTFDHTLWPYVLMLVIDTISNFTGDKSAMWSLLAYPITLGLGLWISVEITFRLGGFIAARLFPKIEADVRTEMFDYVQHHSYQYFSSHFAGSIANKISDMPQCMTRILQNVSMLFLPVILAVIISLAFFAWVQYVFALILGLWLFLHIAICLYFSKKCDHLSHIHAESRSSLAGKIVDSLSNALNVRLFARYKDELRFINKAQNEEVEKHTASLYYIEIMKFALGMNYMLIAGIALNWYMLWSWQQDIITTGEVVFIFNTSWNISMMAWAAGLELPNLFKEIGVSRQAMTIIQDVHGIQDAKDAPLLEVKQGEIVFNNVSFEYQKGRRIFQNLNVTIPAKQKVGLVGFSGSGKSTFVNLMLRYFDIQDGTILIDGQNISKVAQNSLRRNISMIPQDTTLFHRSLIENIHYGRLEASHEEVIAASKMAHCHEFVERMPEKYRSLVGERGVKLSGGQRQRIAIARALLKKAPILILDEATSALDSVTEQQIQEGFELLMNGRTTIVIAHRLSTLSGMDRILVFREGQIVEDGSHDELLAAGNYYAELWSMQSGGLLLDEEDNDEEE